jgi:predicted RNA binding protein YcfA (HicA-like mRNA interferase family)
MILSYASGPGLLQLGYSVTRQTGSRLCLTACEYGEHHLTIPLHSPLRIGTLSAILADVSTHFNLTREQQLQNLFA